MRAPIALAVALAMITTPVLADNADFDNYVEQLKTSGYISTSTSSPPQPISVTYKDNYGNIIPVDVYIYYNGYPLTTQGLDTTYIESLSEALTNVENLSEDIGWLITAPVAVPAQYLQAYTYFKDMYEQVVTKISNVKDALNELMQIGNIGTLNVEYFDLQIQLQLAGTPTVVNSQVLPQTLQQLVTQKSLTFDFKLMYPEAHIYLSFGLKKFENMFNLPVKVVYRYDYPSLSNETYAQLSIENQDNGSFTIRVTNTSQTNNVFNVIIIDGDLTISKPSDLNVISTISNDINNGDLADAVKAASSYISISNKVSFPVVSPGGSDTTTLQGYPLDANKGAAIVICPVSANFIQGYIVDKINSYLSQENINKVIPITAEGVSVNVSVQAENGKFEVSGSAPGGVLLLVGPGTPYDVTQAFKDAVVGETLSLVTTAEDLDVSMPSTADLVKPVIGTVTPIYVPSLQTSTPATVPVKTPVTAVIALLGTVISAMATRRGVGRAS